ncbi:MAG: lipoate--protein ligase [Gemmatimonadota bacterium]|nr:lipoate--protein ligase [Gemmatimonadota bacterium]
MEPSSYPKVWRLIADDGVSASFGLAADDAMARRQTGTPIVRLYSYRSHTALLGRFQHVGDELHADYCAANGIEINRRPTGGGTILMGEDQLGVGVTIPRDLVDRKRTGVRELFLMYGAGIIEGLSKLGIDAQFHRKNDIEVLGRKIAGMGIYAAKGGGVLFHTSLLVDLDVPLMLSVLKTPFEKISDKQITSIAERMTTVRKELGQKVSLEHVRDAISMGYESTLGVTLDISDFTNEERANIHALENDQYLSDDWIHQRSFPADTFGHASKKTPGGLIHAHITLAGDFIKTVYITGDFFAEEGAVSTLERALKRTHADPAEIRSIVDAVYNTEEDFLQGVPPGAVARVVFKAVEAARGIKEPAHSGGCFA